MPGAAALQPHGAHAGVACRGFPLQGPKKLPSDLPYRQARRGQLDLAVVCVGRSRCAKEGFRSTASPRGGGEARGTGVRDLVRSDRGPARLRGVLPYMSLLAASFSLPLGLVRSVAWLRCHPTTSSLSTRSRSEHLWSWRVAFASEISCWPAAVQSRSEHLWASRAALPSKRSRAGSVVLRTWRWVGQKALRRDVRQPRRRGRSRQPPGMAASSSPAMREGAFEEGQGGQEEGQPQEGDMLGEGEAQEEGEAQKGCSLCGKAAGVPAACSPHPRSHALDDLAGGQISSGDLASRMSTRSRKRRSRRQNEHVRSRNQTVLLRSPEHMARLAAAGPARHGGGPPQDPGQAGPAVAVQAVQRHARPVGQDGQDGRELARHLRVEPRAEAALLRGARGPEVHGVGLGCQAPAVGEQDERQAECPCPSREPRALDLPFDRRRIPARGQPRIRRMLRPREATASRQFFGASVA